MKRLATLLLLATVVAAEDTDPWIDQLFHADEAKRANARDRLGTLEGDVLGKLLDRIEARQRQAERVLQVYAVTDIEADMTAWRVRREQLTRFDAVVRQERNGTLVVLAGREVNGKIATFLARIRKHPGRVVTITGAIVKVGDRVRTPRQFARGELAKWLRANDLVMERFPRMTSRNGQRVELSTMRSISYVADFDVELAQGTWIADPVADSLPSGLALHVRVIAATAIDLQIEVRVARVTQVPKGVESPGTGGPVRADRGSGAAFSLHLDCASRRAGRGDRDRPGGWESSHRVGRLEESGRIGPDTQVRNS